MCNHAAGLSRCLTKVQDSLVTQYDKPKGKSSSKTKDAAHELNYNITLNRSMTHAMARKMQDLSKGVFIYMANLTLTPRDSDMDYLKDGIK